MQNMVPGNMHLNESKYFGKILKTDKDWQNVIFSIET